MDKIPYLFYVNVFPDIAHERIVAFFEPPVILCETAHTPLEGVAVFLLFQTSKPATGFRGS